MQAIDAMRDDIDQIAGFLRGSMPEGKATRERFGPLVLGGLLKVCNVRRVLDQARAVLALPAWDATSQGQQQDGVGGKAVVELPLSARERAKARRTGTTASSKGGGERVVPGGRRR